MGDVVFNPLRELEILWAAGAVASYSTFLIIGAYSI